MKMPASCCAIGCRNRHVGGTDKKFFRFPKLDLERRQLWVKAVGRADWEPNDGTRICSDHFLFGEKSDNPECPNYVPTVFHATSTPGKKGKSCNQSQKRLSGQKKRRKSTSVSVESDNKETAISSLTSEESATLRYQANSSLAIKIGGIDSETSCTPTLMEPETLLYCLEEETRNSLGDETSADPHKQSQLHKRRKKVPIDRPRRARKARFDEDYITFDNLFSSDDDEDTDSAPEVREMIRKSQIQESLGKPSVSKTDQSTQTIIEHTYIRNLEEECYNLRCELSRIKGKYLFRDMELEMFKDNNDKVRYLTGLEDYLMLKTLSDIISEHQRDLVRLSSFQQLMVTLMKIKLNLPMKLFAVLFNINLTSISRVFNETIDLLFKALVPLYIVWPNREDMRRIIPPELSDCENCVYIADTFDMQVDLSNGLNSLSSSLDGSSDSGSFMSNNCPKVRRFLMTIAPQGSVIYISKGVRGEVSDRTLALESGFFENIAPGDVILTEKELGIDDAVAVMGASLRSSNSVRSPGKPLMNEGDENNLRRLVRIKRVIQLLRKKFVILDNKVPINWVKQSEKESHTTLDKIVHVVCSLANMTNKIWTYEKYLPQKLQTISC